MLRTKWIFFISLFVIAVGCGGGKNDDAAAGGSGGGGQNASTGTANDSDASTTNLDNPKVVVKTGNCGDKVVQAPEECDDGNNVDKDGCSNGCEWNCKKDDDCKSDVDVCSGGTMTCNLTTHACEAGAGKKADGEPCKENSWCYNGKCYKLECGNGVVQKGEECDDGNSDDADGCTKRCTYSCGSATELGSTTQNICDPTATCDSKTHKWTKGAPLKDGTPCKRGTGYCSSGVCNFSVCGDGKTDPNEKCDDGADNGKAGKCSTSCTVGVCGNNTIETGEDCDDGNTKNFDGCDYRCKAEATFRGAALKISTEDAPAGCMYANTPNKGNAFKNLFPVDPSTGTNAILDLLNSAITDSMTKGQIVTIFQGIDVDDYTGKVPDPAMTVGIAMGKAKGDWPADPSKESTLDIPILAYKSFYENDQPKSNIVGETVLINGAPVVRSTTTVKAGFNIMGMNWELSNMLAYLQVDSDFTPLPPPLKTAPGLTVPNSLGNPFGDKLTAYFCGAFTKESFKSIPLIDILAGICLDQFGDSLVGGKAAYRPCTEDNPLKQLKEGRCDSFFDVFYGGCSAGMGVLKILEPIGEPDVDINGDGTKDAYSTVVRVAAQRASLVGLTDPPDGGTSL
jgi:cysteine-rich repeat protein